MACCFFAEMDIGLGDVEEPEKQLFDCCICGQRAPSTNERLIGLVTLLQPSSGMHFLLVVLFVHPFILKNFWKDLTCEQVCLQVFYD